MQAPLSSFRKHVFLEHSSSQTDTTGVGCRLSLRNRNFARAKHVVGHYDTFRTSRGSVHDEARSRLAFATGNRAVALVKRTRRLPLYGQPHHLAIPGGIVALVGSKGQVILTAKAARLIGPTRVRLVDGKVISNGYLLHLTSIGKTRHRGSLNIRWRTFGQFRYFDTRDWSPTIVGGPVERSQGNYLDDPKETWSAVRMYSRKFSGGIPGLPHSAPEAKLVDEYIAWLRADAEFEHDYLPTERLFTDLFDHSYWRLLEAKAQSDRRTLRSAVGQLLDYKRFYARTPSLGVLLPGRPSTACLKFLRDYGVTAVWRTPMGRFCDSSENRGWTSNRRRPKYVTGAD